MTHTTSPQIRATAKELDLRLKTTDEDRWLATRYAPREKRATLVAFFSFVHELERALLVSEPMLGRIRVQWWREIIDQIFSNQTVRSHDLALVLKDEFGNNANFRPMLDALLDSYDDVLDGIENTENPPRIENGAHVALCAARLIDSNFADFSESIAACGRAYVSARMGNPCAVPRLEIVQQCFAEIPLHFGGAILYVATASAHMTGEGISPLGRRWRIFKTVLSGKISF